MILFKVECKHIVKKRTNTKFNFFLDEKTLSVGVDNLLSLRTEPDPFLIEREQHEQEVILEQLRIQHSELRKSEILAAMSNTLNSEQKNIEAYQVLRETTTRDILQAESDAKARLNRVVWDKDRGRLEVVDRIMHDEQLQRTAVGSLIEQNDARSWALMEQVRLVETQLLRMTRIELDRKQNSVDSQLVITLYIGLYGLKLILIS